MYLRATGLHAQSLWEAMRKVHPALNIPPYSMVGWNLQFTSWIGDPNLKPSISQLPHG
jgi:hypothetical protein